MATHAGAARWDWRVQRDFNTITDPRRQRNSEPTFPIPFILSRPKSFAKMPSETNKTTLEWSGSSILPKPSSHETNRLCLGATTFRLKTKGLTIFLDTWLEKPSVMPKYLAIEDVEEC